MGALGYLLMDMIQSLSFFVAKSHEELVIAKDNPYSNYEHNDNEYNQTKSGKFYRTATSLTVIVPLLHSMRMYARHFFHYEKDMRGYQRGAISSTFLTK